MPESGYLYQNILDRVRADILSGKFQPGDRLPTVRMLCKDWNCTPATVQRAYTELARQGLILGRPGKGTCVADAHTSPLWETHLAQQASLHQAFLLNRTETFLLESISAGYSLEEIEQALNLGVERWRIVKPAPPARTGGELRFCGSHDVAINWLGAHFNEILPQGVIQVNFSGSLGGLIALARGEADLAGCHLWDAETDCYNEPFVRRLLPGERVTLVNLAQRQIGLFLPPGNPRRITGLADLFQTGLRFANRQAGSGTRVWLDAQIQQRGFNPDDLHCVREDKWTHTDVARSVAEGEADAGIGLEASAAVFRLDFLPLTWETYDLVFLTAAIEQTSLMSLVEWLTTERAKEQIGDFPGYRSTCSGTRREIGPG